MTAFLLIHGACHRAACWDAVTDTLTRAGHTARAIDLPGRGADTRLHANLTLDDYAEAILSALDGPTVLVGHSAGGFAISAAAEKSPRLITRLIYLCAFLPEGGASLTGMVRGWPRAPLQGIARATADGASYAIDPARDDHRLAQDATPAQRAASARWLCPEPMRPHAEPIQLGANWQSVPRSYIRCTHDQTIDPARQSEMAAACQPEDRYDMPTGHSPFLTDPAALAALLIRIAEGR